MAFAKNKNLGALCHELSRIAARISRAFFSRTFLRILFHFNPSTEKCICEKSTEDGVAAVLTDTRGELPH
jgi:hypothetical protein